MIATLDHLHAHLYGQPQLYRIVVATRLLFAAAFIPTGLVKLLGQRFSAISLDHPIGAFFEAMYQTGGYWQFLGASQVVAGLLLLIPATATVGAVLFAPIIVNIFVITVALEFKGTWVLTSAMMVGVTSLLAWDWHRLRGIVTPAPPPAGLDLARPALTSAVERGSYALGAASLLTVFAGTRSFVGGPAVTIAIFLGLAAGLSAIWFFIRARSPATQTDPKSNTKP